MKGKALDVCEHKKKRILNDKSNVPMFQNEIEIGYSKVVNIKAQCIS